jgi:hypothetical protein
VGYLTIYSETGFPHAGSVLEYANGRIEWLGYEPSPGSILGGYGYIDNTNHEDRINHYVRLRVSESALRSARGEVVADYWSKLYQVGTCDCVSFVRDLAGACWLDTGPGPSLFPYQLVRSIKGLNSEWTNYDDWPFPWRVAAVVGQWRVRVHTWTWIYDFSKDDLPTPGGRARWTDPFNGMTGTGTWKLTSGGLTTSWAPDSNATEEWELAPDLRSSVGHCYMEDGTYRLSATKIS